MIVIHLPPDVEEKLRESIAHADEAAAKQILQDALPVIAQALLNPKEKSNPGQLEPEELEALLNELADGIAQDMGPNPPQFGPEAFSRDSIYEGHPKL